MSEPTPGPASAGGTHARPTYAASSVPWPDAPAVAPAVDPHPIEALEAAMAGVLDLRATAVIAYADSDEAYRAALDTPDEGRDEAVIAAVGTPQAAQAARSGGWRVVPAEVEADTATLSLRGLTHASGPETALAVAGHTFGHPAPMTELLRRAREQQITLVEDVTGALGATYRREPVGRLGHRAVMATSPEDPVTHGTFVFATDPEEATTLRAQRREAIPEEAARVALAEIRRLGKELEHRRHLAWELTFALHGMRGIAPMAHGRWVQHAYARYVLRLRSAIWGHSLADTVAALRDAGIPAVAACAPSLHRDAAVREALPDDPRVRDDVFTVASTLPDELIAMPLHAGLTSKEMERVAAALRQLEAQST